VHPGQEFLDACFGVQEVWRLEAVELAKRDPRSVWFELPASRQRRASGSRNPDKRRVGSPRRDVLSVTCGCCGRAFVGRRRSARFCGELCRKRAGRGRCGEEMEVAS
jgi:hypothetical protein